MAETVIQGDRGLVVVLESGKHRTDDLFHGVFGIVVEHGELFHLHFAVGDRARLIQTENVHAGEHFQGIHIVDERMVLGQTDDAQGHGDGDQKKHPRGDHAYDHGTSRLNGFGQFRQRFGTVDPEDADGDEQHQRRDDADEEVGGISYFRVRPLVFFGLGREAVDVCFPSDGRHAHAAVAADHKGARQELVARRLMYGDRFAR